MYPREMKTYVTQKPVDELSIAILLTIAETWENNILKQVKKQTGTSIKWNISQQYKCNKLLIYVIS